MKTIDLIKTIQWLDAQVGPATKELLFSRRLFSGRQREVGTAQSTIEPILQISNEIALAQQAISNHPFAPKVLTSFGIKKLFEAKFIATILTSTIAAEPGKIERGQEMWMLLSSWEAMQSCAKPLQELTLPLEVAQEKEFDEVLTMQVLRDDQTMVTLQTLRNVIDDIEKLYRSFLTLQKGTSAEPLQVVYLASGSSIRIDLKGLGDPIKQIKNLLVEGWSLWRHRKSTEPGAEFAFVANVVEDLR